MTQKGERLRTVPDFRHEELGGGAASLGVRWMSHKFGMGPPTRLQNGNPSTCTIDIGLISAQAGQIRVLRSYRN